MGAGDGKLEEPEKFLGGENRTGEEEEQRILLEAGGDEAGRSSNMDDLFPHTMADMFGALVCSVCINSLSPRS